MKLMLTWSANYGISYNDAVDQETTFVIAGTKL